MVSKYWQNVLLFRHKHACDGKTDRQNCNPQYRASIAAKRSDKHEISAEQAENGKTKIT